MVQCFSVATRRRLYEPMKVKKVCFEILYTFRTSILTKSPKNDDFFSAALNRRNWSLEGLATIAVSRKYGPKAEKTDRRAKTLATIDMELTRTGDTPVLARTL